jgi:hypothetical protein
MRWKTKVQVARPTTIHPEASCSMRRSEANCPCLSQSPSSMATSSQPSRIIIHYCTRTSWEYLPLTARETSHPCEGHGMAVESYSARLFAFAPQPRTCFQIPRLTRATTTTTLEPLSCVRHWSCYASLASRVINTCDLLHVSVGELQVASHSICRSAEGNIASVPLLPGQPDVFLDHLLNQIRFMLCIVPILNFTHGHSNH